MNELIVHMLAYTVTFLLTVLACNFMSNGLLFKYVRSKTSGGSKCLVRIHGSTDPYVVVGTFKDKGLHYTKRGSKQNTIITPPKGSIDRFFKAYYIEVDEETDAIFGVNKTPVKGVNGETVDSLIKRAVMMPQINDFSKILVLILLVAAIGAAAYSAWVGMQNQEAIAALTNAVAVTSGVVPVN